MGGTWTTYCKMHAANQDPRMRPDHSRLNLSPCCCSDCRLLNSRRLILKINKSTKYRADKGFPRLKLTRDPGLSGMGMPASSVIESTYMIYCRTWIWKMRFCFGFFLFVWYFSRCSGLIVFIGVGSVLQLSSLICIMFVTVDFGSPRPQDGDVLNPTGNKNGHQVSWEFKSGGKMWKTI